MQTLIVLRTIKWLESKFEPIEVVLFRVIPDASRHLRRPDRHADKPILNLNAELSTDVLRALHLSGAIVADVAANASALTVLDAFGLNDLADASFILKLFSSVISPGSPNATDANLIYAARWDHMIACCDPLSRLVIPQELQSDDAADVVFTFEIDSSANVSPSLLVEVIQEVEKLYFGIAKIYELKEPPPLGLLKIESGSNVTLSFKGVAETVKELKNFVLEMWSKHRHKRADEIIGRNRALVSSIEALDQIDKREKKKALAPEDAGRLRHVVVHSVLTLFNDGALITTIPPIEIVDNRKLLEGFTSTKLLPPPRGQVDGDGMTPDRRPNPPAQKKRRSKKP
jgi:hypothetical protein